MNKMKLLVTSLVFATLTMTTFAYAVDCNDVNKQMIGTYTGTVNDSAGKLGVTVDIKNVSSNGSDGRCKISGTMSWENNISPMLEFSSYNINTNTLDLSSQKDSSTLDFIATFSPSSKIIIQYGEVDGYIIDSGTLDRAND